MKIGDNLISLCLTDVNKLSEIDRSKLRLYIFTVVLTSPLMWAHAIMAYFYCRDPFLYQLGVLCCLVHLMSPLIYRFYHSLNLSLNIMILAGFVHPFAWAYYTGGFLGVSPIWFAVHPLVAGLIGTRRDLIIWSLISFVGAAYFFFLHINGIVIANYLPSTGDGLSRIIIMIGLITLNSVFMLVYIVDRDRFNRAIFEKSEQIDTLLTLVGHDISNPLTVINLSQKKLNYLLKDNSNLDIQKCLTRIGSCTAGIGSMLTQIRDLQSIKQGKVALKFERVYLNDVVEYLCKVFESKLHEKGIKLKYDFKKYEGIYVMGNATALKYQILGNLLSNAIKFSEEGKEIRIKLEEDSDGVHIHLMDEGVGIEKSLLDVLFERNSIPSKHGTRGEKGTGFGMSIVKTFVELSHGTIEVKSQTKCESPEKHGTHFLLSFKKTLFS